MVLSLPHCSDLAKYVFGKGIEVRVGEPLEPIRKHLLSMHESYHYHMCCSTPFGLYQRFLGFLTKSSFMPQQRIDQIKSALSKSVDNSWNAHEGVATICEISAYMLAKPNDSMIEYIDTLPDEYRSAINHFAFICGLSDIPLVVLLPVFEGIGYAVLATDILEEQSSYERFLDTNWEKYFNRIEFCPDARLKTFSGKLNKPYLVEQLAIQIKNIMVKEFGTCNQQSFLQDYLGVPLERQVNFQETLKENTISWLRKHMPFFIDDDSQENLTIKHDFMVDSWFKDFGNMGISVVREQREPIRTFDDRYRAFLSQLTYVTADRTGFQKIKEIDISKLDGVLTSFNENESQLYIRFSVMKKDKKELKDVSFKDSKHDTSKMSLHVYSRTSIREELQDQRNETTEISNQKLYVLSFDTPALKEITKKLEKYDLMVACEQLFYLQFVKKNIKDSLGTLVARPLIIIPERSSLDHWLQAISHFEKRQQLVMYHDFWDDKYRAERDYCILTDSRGSVAFVRPSSVWISNWILEKDRRIEKYDCLTKLEEKFSADWVKNVKSFIYHFSSFGF